MAWVAVGVAAVGVGTSLYSGAKGAKAAKAASQAQQEGQQQAIMAQQQQFAEVKKLLSPYISAGQPEIVDPYLQSGIGAIQGMQDLIGFGGEAYRQQDIAAAQKASSKKVGEYQQQRTQQFANLEPILQQVTPELRSTLVNQFQAQTQRGLKSLTAPLEGVLEGIKTGEKYGELNKQRQQQAIQGIEQGPLFQELARQGETGILQNVSATGGLRGGNVQAALGQFRPNLLNQLIEQQYTKLAGLTSLGANTAQNRLNLGQASAATLGGQGMQSAANIGNLLSAQGASQAAGITGAANAQIQGVAGASSAITGAVQNYGLLQAANRPSMSSGVGTGGFSGSYQEAQSTYGGAPVAYQAPAGPGGPGGWYKQQ